MSIVWYQFNWQDDTYDFETSKTVKLMDQLYKDNKVFMSMGSSQGKVYIRMAVSDAMQPSDIPVIWNIISTTADTVLLEWF